MKGSFFKGMASSIKSLAHTASEGRTSNPVLCCNACRSSSLKRFWKEAEGCYGGRGEQRINSWFQEVSQHRCHYIPVGRFSKQLFCWRAKYQESAFKNLPLPSQPESDSPHVIFSCTGQYWAHQEHMLSFLVHFSILISRGGSQSHLFSNADENCPTILYSLTLAFTLAKYYGLLNCLLHVMLQIFKCCTTAVTDEISNHPQ